MLEPTMRHIMEELKRAPFLGMDETHYSINGKRGYVWVVRTPTAVYILALPTRSGAVLPTHFKEILDKKVVADGYTVYATHFKILQRCWAHILRGGEKAYLRSRKGSRKAYHALYRRLLGIFHEAKRIAEETADSGGAGAAVCLAMERRVMELVALYGSHKFGTTLANAAPHLFTFLRHPGMPPSNNDTERDIRDGVVLQRKIRHKFVNAEGRRVFSILQSFNMTCRKLGHVPWRCVERIAENPDFNIFAAEPGPRGAPVPPDAKREPDKLYVDNVPVENPEGWNADGVKEYLASLYSGSQAEKPSGTAEAGRPRTDEETAEAGTQTVQTGTAEAGTQTVQTGTAEAGTQTVQTGTAEAGRPRTDEEAGTQTVQTGTPAGTERSEPVPRIPDDPSGTVAKGRRPNPATRYIHACAGTAFSDAGGIGTAFSDAGGIGNAPRRGKPPPIASA